MFHKFLFILLVISLMGLSFCYGVIVHRNQLFPYQQLLSLKEDLFPLSPALRSTHYRHKKSFFEHHGHHYEIVMVGDSITDAAEWGDLFPEKTIANRGINGDTTAGVLDRLDSILATRADKAFIMLGINDIKRQVPSSRIISNYTNIVRMLNQSGMTVHIQSIFYAGARYKQLNPVVAEVNELLEELAEHEGLIFIDTNSALRSDDRLDARYSFDDLHLNGSGYEVWRKLLVEYMLSERE